MYKADLEVQNNIIKILQRMDIVLYGFAYLGDIISPEFKDTPYAVTIGIPLTPAIVNSVEAGPNQPYYDEYLSINDRLDIITNELKNELEKNGYLAYAISSSKRTDFINIKGDFPHKTAAVRGGLGWIGKSSLLITQKYGPRIRISTVLTDTPFDTNNEFAENYCGKCSKCFDSCPAGAIEGNLWSKQTSRDELIDVKKCDLWKINNHAQFHGHVCGICVAVCPHGKSPK